MILLCSHTTSKKHRKDFHWWPYAHVLGTYLTVDSLYRGRAWPPDSEIQSSKIRLPKRIKQKYTYTQATEGKKSHRGVFNGKEKLYIWEGGEEGLTELNKVSTASTSERKDGSSTRSA